MFIIFEQKIMKLFYILLIIVLLHACISKQEDMKKVVFLHHSTGSAIWLGKTNKYVYKLTEKGDVQKYFASHNKKNKTNYTITERSFPKRLLTDGITIRSIIIISGSGMPVMIPTRKNQLLKY